jgi:hypothetical protein
VSEETKGTPKRLTIEDVLGDFGFRVRWLAQDHWVDFEVFEVIGLGDKGPMFYMDGGNGSSDTVETIDSAEHYTKGFVKWDGCSHVEQVESHLCGKSAWVRHRQLLEYLWTRAFQLMGTEEPE